MSDPATGPRGLTPSELADLDAVFAEAAHADGDARRSLLDARCAGRPRFRAEVEALLASHDSAGDFLHAPDRGPGAEDLPDHDRLRIGSLVGPYRLIERIGEGGMGDVYLGERADGLFTHRVAVKVTRTSVRDGETARRFRSERQILASLQHPNIVTLLDGGATSSGEAYVVMEHVAGVPITRHCRDHALTLEQRVRLVGQVAAAVQFAHQRGIVHRDLKPANILVTDDGVPKVLDFGVAKLLESSSLVDATVTRAFPGPLTPNYASPEQLRGLPVTTASDVYALGVLAYEVVTGVRPYDTSGKALDEVLAIVLETEPSRPSAASATSRAEDVPAYARARLKGDLDAIVLKAMSKVPERRYGSAGELADDLDRFLAGTPVVAREPSLGYMLRRLAARNKAVVSVAAAAIVVILGALGVALWQRQLAVRAQARAEQRFNDTRQLANALIFKIHDAVAPLAGSTPVRQTIVSEALAYLERLERESGGDESLQLELSRAYRQIGFIQGNPNSANLGNRDEALKQYEKARRLGRPLALQAGATPGAISNLVNIDVLMSRLAKQAGRMADAAPLAQEAVDQAQRVIRLTGDTADSRRLLGGALFEQALLYHPTPASIPHWDRARAHYEQDLTSAPDDEQHQRNVALVCKYLGSVHESAGRDHEASLFLRRALTLDERRAAANPDRRLTQFDLAVSLSSLATNVERARNNAEAAELYSKSLQIRERLADSDPKDVLGRGKVGYVQMRLARVELELGQATRARERARAAVATLEDVLQKTNDSSSRRDFGGALYTLGAAERKLGQPARACLLFERAAAAFGATPASAYLDQLQLEAEAAHRACQTAKPTAAQ